MSTTSFERPELDRAAFIVSTRVACKGWGVGGTLGPGLSSVTVNDLLVEPGGSGTWLEAVGTTLIEQSKEL